MKAGAMAPAFGLERDQRRPLHSESEGMNSERHLESQYGKARTLLPVYKRSADLDKEDPRDSVCVESCAVARYFMRGNVLHD